MGRPEVREGENKNAGTKYTAQPLHSRGTAQKRAAPQFHVKQLRSLSMSQIMNEMRRL